jgi:tRNA(Ile2) C34 agmatinyltransferase TiaS
MTSRRDADDEPDDRPPICPACGVTMGMEVTGGKVRFVCLECGFSDSEDAVD